MKNAERRIIRMIEGIEQSKAGRITVEDINKILKGEDPKSYPLHQAFPLLSSSTIPASGISLPQLSN